MLFECKIVFFCLRYEKVIIISNNINDFLICLIVVYVLCIIFVLEYIN